MESSDDESSIRESKPQRKGVRFLRDEHGQVKCFVKEIARINNPKLWWSPEESQAILRDCCRVVEYYQGKSQRLCTTMTKFLLFKWIDEDHPLDAILDFLQNQHPHVLGRGLEQHAVGTISEPTEFWVAR